MVFSFHKTPGESRHHGDPIPFKISADSMDSSIPSYAQAGDRLSYNTTSFRSAHYLSTPIGSGNAYFPPGLPGNPFHSNGLLDGDVSERSQQFSLSASSIPRPRVSDGVDGLFSQLAIPALDHGILPPGHYGPYDFWWPWPCPFCGSNRPDPPVPSNWAQHASATLPETNGRHNISPQLSAFPPALGDQSAFVGWDSGVSPVPPCNILGLASTSGPSIGFNSQPNPRGAARVTAPPVSREASTVPPLQSPTLGDTYLSALVPDDARWSAESQPARVAPPSLEHTEDSASPQAVVFPSKPQQR